MPYKGKVMEELCLNCPVLSVCHFPNHYIVVCMRHIKINETMGKHFPIKTFAFRDGGEKSTEAREK